MNIKRFLILGIICLMIATFAVSCCKNDAAKSDDNQVASTPWNQPTGEGESVAEINGIKIYMNEFKKRIESQSPYIKAKYNSLEKRKEFLDSMIRFELLSQAAIELDLQNDPEVLQAAKQVMTQILMKKKFDTSLKREDISEEDMRAYYEEHKANYNKPAMRRASHILIKVPEGVKKAEWDKALKKAKAVYKQALADKNSPNSFRKLAAKTSQDQTNKNRGGDLGYFASTIDGGPKVKEISDAVFKMDKINSISKPIKTKFGYHIFRLTGKRDKITRSFDMVKSQIQHRLYKERRTAMFNKFIEDLHAKAKIVINDQILKDYEVPGAAPVAKKEKQAPKNKIIMPKNIGNKTKKPIKK